MLTQILIGISMIVLSIIIQAIFIEISARKFIQHFGSFHPNRPKFRTYVLTVSTVTLWLSFGLLCVVFLWSGVFLLVDVFATWEESFYFSLVSFTTLGFGDVILPVQWRLLSGFIAMDGFLLFGLNTAVLLEVIMRLRDA